MNIYILPLLESKNYHYLNIKKLVIKILTITNVSVDKKGNVCHVMSVKGFLNQGCPFLNGRSLQITLTVPLILLIS